MEKLLAFYEDSQAKLADALGVTGAMVCMCMAGKRKLSPEKVKLAEKLTGIPRAEIRPDIYD